MHCFRPERAKAFVCSLLYVAFALTGRHVAATITQGVALGLELLPLQGDMLQESLPRALPWA